MDDAFEPLYSDISSASSDTDTLPWLSDDNDERNTILSDITSDEDENTDNANRNIILNDITSDEDEKSNDGSDFENDNFGEIEIEPILMQAGQGSSDINVKNLYELSEPEVRRVRRFKTEGKVYDLIFKNLNNVKNFYGILPNLFDSVVNDTLEGTDEHAYVGMQFSHENLKHPILIPFQRHPNIDGRLILDTIQNILQSNQEFEISDGLAVMKVVTVVPPHGGRPPKRHSTYIVEKEFSNRGHGGCFIRIQNNDNLCLARAIVVAIAHFNKTDSMSNWNTLRRSKQGSGSLQTKKAIELMKRAGLSQHKGHCGIGEMCQIQKVLNDYKLKVFGGIVRRTLIFEGKFTSIVRT
jgi:hypothetical protein